MTNNNFRPPAIPLVACDPYFSIWSITDSLCEDWPRHWTGTIHGLASMIIIDDKTYRLMGIKPVDVEALKHISVKVLPTRTIYEFEKGGIRLTLTFITPTIPYDIKLAAKPITYITYEVKSVDGKEHSVKIYYDNCAEIAVNDLYQKVVWSRYQHESLNILRVGTLDQPVLEKYGDNLRIDWGYLYMVTKKESSASTYLGDDVSPRNKFAKEGQLPKNDDLRNPREVKDNWPVMSYAFDFGKVLKPQSTFVLLAYDDIFSLQYFHRKIRPLWRHKGLEAIDLIEESINNYEATLLKCRKFDEELISDLTKAGGEKYAAIASLAYRQCFAAHKIAVEVDGTVLMFSKENFSNGCMGTVDVIYPASPLFLFFNIDLFKAQLTPVLDYAKKGAWSFPYAPHDLGQYPHANGQVYGGGEKTEKNQMPVEESGDMLLMLAAISKVEGNVDYAAKYWEIITKWAEYLKQKGLDPENQLCTDDFAGHLAHNVNLSLKAILALDAYSMMCAMAGKKEDAEQYHKTAAEFAKKWETMAIDGDHYKLAFDKPGTWSQKYNLVWDKILGLNLFSDEITKKEIKYYLTKQNKYGLPLDSRKEWTKSDWLVWTATLADSQTDFESFIAPLYDFLNDSTSRIPFPDFYWTNEPKFVRFQARSVVGGVFIKMLTDTNIWKKWIEKSK